MKNRNGFVSNSSSSSFVVIGKGPVITEKYGPDALISFGTGIGETEFGWQPRDYRCFHDRVNFALIQALYLKDQELFDKILKMVKDFTGACEVVHNISLNDCYIDHQSCATEDVNIEIFKDNDALYRFLFCKDSYIHTDNDNGME